MTFSLRAYSSKIFLHLILLFKEFIMKKINLLTGVLALTIASLASASTTNMKESVMHSDDIKQEISYNMGSDLGSMNYHKPTVREYDRRMKGDK
ncbi:hypothetical protein HYE53_04790 [Aggregatibacter actinomycetemcomitans]|nr:hypothetical protein [Aggregatibacter actinomycetemcomitans]MBN6074079.1 hypothetical protein [Aggregatibacter actinomycetemcomitans]